MKKFHIGPIPPPIGGISIYLQRLSKIENNSVFIDEARFIGEGKYNLKLVSSLLYYFKWISHQFLSREKKLFVYHNHLLLFRLNFYFLSLISIHDFALVIHGQSLFDQYTKSNIITRFLIVKMLSRAKFIQVVNIEYKELLKIISIDPSKILIKNAFIPPPLDNELEILKNYDETIKSFIKSRSPLMASNSGFIRFYNGIDIYGLDLCIELTSMLKIRYPHIGFIFALADNKKERDYIEKLKNRIKELKLEKSFIFLTGQKEFWPILKKIDIFLRPTFIDGAPVSLEEARFFNCPTIASDVTIRPEGVVTFKNRDLNDLHLKVLKMLENIRD